MRKCIFTIIVFFLVSNVYALDIFEVDYDGTTTLWWFHQEGHFKSQLYSTLDYDWVKGLLGPSVKVGKWNFALLGGLKASLQEERTKPTHGCVSFSAMGEVKGNKILLVQSFDKGLAGGKDCIFTTLRVTRGKLGLRLKEFQEEPFHVPAVAGPVLLWPVDSSKSVEVFWGLDLKNFPRKTLWISYVHMLF